MIAGNLEDRRRNRKEDDWKRRGCASSEGVTVVAVMHTLPDS